MQLDPEGPTLHFESMRPVERALLEIEQGCPSGSVIRDADLLDKYASDESEVAACIPEAVVRVGSTSQVAHVMKCAHRYSIPVTPRAGGTGRVGGAVPVKGGIVIAFEQMQQITGLETDDQFAVVEPGVITGTFHREVEAENLFYPPDPNSLDSCTIGGNLAANAGGPRAYKYGVTREYVLGMQAVLADGTILNLGRQTVKGVTGYDLSALIVGSEGTLALVTEATLKLVKRPERVATLLVLLAEPASVTLALRAMLNAGIVPRCVELMDEIVLDLVRPKAGLAIPKDAKAMLLIELDGDDALLESETERCGNALLDAGALDVLIAKNIAERERLWSARRELSHTLREQAAFKMSEDIVVPRTKIPDLLADCRKIAETHHITMPTYGHAGDGNLHVNFLWDDDDAKVRVDQAIRSLFESVLSMKGTLSGEHGIGVLKAPYLPMEQSTELIALQNRIKDVFDPKRILNPGKIFPADAKRFHGAC